MLEIFNRTLIRFYLVKSFYHIIVIARLSNVLTVIQDKQLWNCGIIAISVPLTLPLVKIA